MSLNATGPDSNKDLHQGDTIMDDRVTINVNYRAFVIAHDVLLEHRFHKPCIEVCEENIGNFEKEGEKEKSRLWREAKEFLIKTHKNPKAVIYARGTADEGYFTEGKSDKKIHIELPDGLFPEMPEELKKEIEEEEKTKSRSPEQSDREHKTGNTPPDPVDFDDDAPF